MKKILIITIALFTFAQANAQTPAAAEVKATVSVSAETAPVKAVEVIENDATAGSGPSLSANFVGTNDLNLAILRAGIKKA